MALQNFADKVGPVVSAAWLNVVDALKFTVFGDAVTKPTARTALTSDIPFEVVNGGTGSRTAKDGMWLVDSGAVNALVVTTIDPFAYVVGASVDVYVNNTNTLLSPTLNVNGLGAVTIATRAASTINIGDLVAGSTYRFTYDGNRFLAMALPKFGYVNHFLSKYKSTETDRVNNTVSADPDLFVNVPPGTYEFRAVLFPKCNTAAAQGLSVSMVVSSGSYGRNNITGLINGANINATQASANTANTYGVVGTGAATEYLVMEGVVTTTGVNPSISVQWAQNTTNASFTAMQVGSYLKVTRLNL